VIIHGRYPLHLTIRVETRSDRQDRTAFQGQRLMGKLWNRRLRSRAGKISFRLPPLRHQMNQTRPDRSAVLRTRLLEVVPEAD
ncbi:MAG TPA: hypothetical protein PLB32_16835, partial [Acidobacteriota bacterium]|nr:hypothetical protein [Acidobacteriota bacterium]